MGLIILKINILKYIRCCKSMSTEIKYDAFMVDYDITYMNWIGKYTFGSCHVRGTSIQLFSNVGKIIDSGGRNTFKEPGLNYVMPEESEALFRDDDNSIRLEGFDVKSENLKDRFFFDPSKPLFDENGYKINDEMIAELNENPSNTFYLKEGVLISLKIPEQLILDEIKEVEKIAHEHYVTLIWI